MTSEAIPSTLIAMGWTPQFHQQWLVFLDEHAHLPGLGAWRVVSVQRGEYRVSQGAAVERAVLPGRFQTRLDLRWPCVGDFVLVERQGDGSPGRIEHVFEPASLLARKEPGATSAHQAIAANVDLAVIVGALADPTANHKAQQHGLNVRRMERYLFAAGKAGINALIAINKADLHHDATVALAELKAALGPVEIILLSAHSGEGLEALERRLAPRSTSVLLGSSGVGKSSIINRLLGREAKRTAAIRSQDARGCHTTTDRELFALPNGALLIDSPGMRELGLAATDAGAPAPLVFSDLEALAERCRFADCRHVDEPGCAVLSALERGELPSERLQHARKLEREQLFQKERHDLALRSARQKQHRALSRTIRARMRDRNH